MLTQHGKFMTQVAPIRAALLDLVVCHQEERSQRGIKPAPGAPASKDDADESQYTAIEGRPAVTPRLLGGLQLAAAEDLIRAVCGLVALVQAVLFADKVLGRAACEAAARANWLLDPAVDTRVRVGRGLTERLYAIEQQRKLHAGDIDADDALEYTKASSKEIVRMAEAAGFTVIRPKRQAPFVSGCERPDATKAMRILFGVDGDLDLGASVQSYLSMFVHATTTGLISVGDLDRTEPSEAGISHVPLMGDSKSVNSLLTLCALAYVNAVDAHRTLMGWDDPTWLKVRANLGHLSNHFNR